MRLVIKFNLKWVILLVLGIAFHFVNGQTYPTFGPEILVTILGDTVPDAMEPFISPDGNYLFFNSLNNGTTTTLYYATKVNDSTFTFAGRLTGANLLSPPHLDAVASLDSANRFFWVTTRNYGATYNNLFHGVFTGSSAIDTGRVYGSLYITSPGWIIMDAAINYNGGLIYYANAYFNSCAGGIPCISQLGIAQKVNDSTYNKIATSAQQLFYVNDTGYLVYAENVTKDGLELYYTRIKKGSFQTELCVAVRGAVTDTFSLPSVIYTNPAYIIEAPTLTTDKTRLYYHKKVASNFKIYLRYRNVAAGLNNIIGANEIEVYPNPATNRIQIKMPTTGDFKVEIYDVLGKEVYAEPNRTNIDITYLNQGVYSMIISNKQGLIVKKIIKI
jgi:hypothetical protein